MLDQDIHIQNYTSLYSVFVFVVVDYYVTGAAAHHEFFKEQIHKLMSEFYSTVVFK